jgi:hypothetical protein
MRVTAPTFGLTGHQCGDDSDAKFYVGWDVGGWNCDKNGKSRDAIAILDSRLTLCGKPWRGNLRECMNKSGNALEWLNCLFDLCGAKRMPADASAVMAIDTPLGFSEQFVQLVCNGRCVESIDSSDTNQYLFRETERFLCRQGFKPLSAIKDMIGSQATKGIHALAKFAPTNAECGIWRGGDVLIAIEAYPSACKRSKSLCDLHKRGKYKSLGHQDKDDALTCALIAHLFSRKRKTLILPPADVPKFEGWIWMPRDALRAAE